MNFETLLKEMARAFLIIVTGIVAGNYAISLIFTPDAFFPVSHFGRILLCALLSDFPYIIFYSPKELSKRQMFIRHVIHGIVLLAVLLIMASIWNWIDFGNPFEMAIYLLVIAAIYVVVYASSYFADKKTADKLNEGLRERYKK